MLNRTDKINESETTHNILLYLASSVCKEYDAFRSNSCDMRALIAKRLHRRFNCFTFSPSEIEVIR